MKTRLALIGGCIGATLGPALAGAAVIETVQVDVNAMNAFAVSNSDLINQGQATLLSVTGAGGGPAPLQSIAVNDGSAGANNIDNAADYMSYDGPGNYQVIYNLNTALSPGGYDISSISLYSGSTIYRLNQVFGVSYTTVDNPTPQSLGTHSKTVVVNSAPVAGYEDLQTSQKGSIALTLTDDQGLLATGVNSIIFTLYPDSSSLPGNDLGTRYREFDVVGSATVPEPAGVALLGLAGLFGLRRRRV